MWVRSFVCVAVAAPWAFFAAASLSAAAPQVITLGPVTPNAELTAVASGPADYEVAIGEGLVVVSGRSTTKTPAVVSVAAYGVESRSELFSLHAPLGSNGGEFGAAIAIGHGVIAVSQTRSDFDPNDFGGRVHLYSAADGAYLRTIDAPNLGLPVGASVAQFAFGEALDIDQGRLLVGSPSAVPGAYLFDLATGGLLMSLQSDVEGGRFGSGVALNGGLALIGEPGRGFTRGEAHLYDLTTGEKVRTFMPDPDQPLAGNGSSEPYGISVGLDGGVAAVGAPRFDAVFAYDVTNGDLLAELHPERTGRFQRFGDRLAIDAGVIVASNPGETDFGRYGVAYAYDAVTGERLLRFPAGGSVIFGGGVDVRDGLIATTGPRSPQVTLHAVVPEPSGMALFLLTAGVASALRR